MKNKSVILVGSALEILKTLPADSVDCCMTSPPYYGLRDYGVDGQLGLEPTPKEYINNLCDIFDEVKRVLKPTGTCWVNIGDSYAGSGNGSCNAKPSQIGKQHRGKNKKAAFLCDGSNKKNIGIPTKSLIQIPARFSLEMSARGWILRNMIIWYKRRVLPSSATDRFTIDYEPLFFFTKSAKYYYFKQQLEPLAASTKKRIGYPWVEGDNKLTIGGGQHAGLDGKSFNKMMDRMKSSKGRNMRCVWKVNHGGDFKGGHFAPMPPALCEVPLDAGCPVGGVVLDPFSGAGTTGLVAIKQKKQYIGIELNPEYADMSEQRLHIGKYEGKFIE